MCRSSGAVGDVDCTVGAAPCLVPSSTQGFTIDVAEVTFWGLCPDCAARRWTFPATEDRRKDVET